MSDPDALLAAIVAAPDDDLPRLVYADWLDDSGDPADADRAAFIRLQLALEDTALPAPRRAAMQREADALLRRGEAEWLGPLGSVVHEPFTSWGPDLFVKWHRGWPHTVMLSSDLTWTVLDALALTVSLNTNILGVLYRFDLAADFFLRPESRKVRALSCVLTDTNVRELSLAGYALGDSLVGELVSSNLLARLHALDLSRCEITDRGAATLAGCPDYLGLKSLNLDGNPITEAGRANLLRAWSRTSGRPRPRFGGEGGSISHV